MKARLDQLVKRIDGASMRERIVGFGGALVVCAFLGYMVLLAPVFAKQKQMTNSIRQNMNNIAGTENEIATTTKNGSIDPDLANRQRLEKLSQEIVDLSEKLRRMQKGLVPPEGVVPLLEGLLRSQRGLRLVHMRTLPRGDINAPLFSDVPESTEASTEGGVGLMGKVRAMQEDAARAQHENNPVNKAARALGALNPDRATAAPKPAAAPKEGAAKDAGGVDPNQLLFRHAIELTLEGNYLDLVAYMRALEAMPTQLFWGRAKLDVLEHPNARLSIVVYTLSLDQKWLKL